VRMEVVYSKTCLQSMFRMYGWHQNHISNYVFLFQKILYFKIVGSINIFHKPMLHMS